MWFWLFKPVTISGITLAPNQFTAINQSGTGTVTLSGPAPVGDAVVTLTSSNTQFVTVAPSVTVKAGATTGTFSFKVLSPPYNQNSYQITATLAASQISATLTTNIQQPIQ
jgi:hypothetical protein